MDRDEQTTDGVTEIGEMQWSAECAELFAAFAIAQAGLGPLVADKTAKVPYKNKKSGTEGEYQYQYAGLPQTLTACLSSYNAAGCSIVQPVSTFDNGVGVRTLITHKSGQWWLSPKVFVPVAQGSGAQDLGSAITYGRRYSLQGAVALSPADGDDDGRGAQRSKPNTWTAPRESSRRASSPEESKQPTLREQGGLREQVTSQVNNVARSLDLSRGCAWRECLAAAGLPSGLGGDDGPKSDDVTATNLAALLRASHEVLSAGVSDPGGPP